MLELRPYQLDCLAAMAAAEGRGVNRQLVVMATGLGKTIVVARRLQEKGFPNALGLMHREELIQQAREKVLLFDPALPIGVEKAASRADLENDRLVLASVQTLGRSGTGRLERFARSWPSFLWVDEVHHAPAASYITVLRHFGFFGDRGLARVDGLLVGTTATPERLDKLGYNGLFDEVVYRYGLVEAIQDRWLADIHAWRVNTEVDLSDIPIRHGDFAEDRLEAAVNIAKRNSLAAKVWNERCRGGRNLFYCVTKAHAHKVAEELKMVGARVAVVIEDTDPEERRKAIMDLKQGALDGIVNVTVLSEGFDVPEISAIHVLRPTKSKLLYTQIIGRGTRRIEGVKEYVDIFDYMDNRLDVCNAGALLGLPPAWDCKGGSALEQKAKLDEAAEAFGLQVDDLTGIEDLARILKPKVEKADLLGRRAAAPAPEPETIHGLLAWLRPSMGDERYVICWNNETEEQLNKLDPVVATKARSVIHGENLYGVRERIEIVPDELGHYQAVLHLKEPGRREERFLLSKGPGLNRAVQQAEDWVHMRRHHKWRLLEKYAPWARKPATEKQLAFLASRGIPKETLLRLALNRRQASNLIAFPNARLEAILDPP